MKSRNRNPVLWKEFLQLLAQSDARIYSYIISLVPNRSDADDLMQETTLTLWDKFSTYERGRDFTPWAIVFARIQILRYYRGTNRNRLVFDAHLMESIEQETFHLIQEEELRLEVLRQCLQKLSAADRNLIHMRYACNRTLQDIGNRMGKSVATIYRLLVRIHDNLLSCVRSKMEGNV